MTVQISPERALAEAIADTSTLAWPPAVELFVGRLRLLIGVPFEALVPDPRLLPQESIRFFFIDRSFTDRLVDGALAVGLSGTRAEAQWSAAYAALRAQLDGNEGAGAPFSILTGFLMRSAVVSGWLDLGVRATGAVTLRLERLAPSVLLAIFGGVPTQVVLEEPHHALQLGVDRDASGLFVPGVPGHRLPVRAADPTVLDLEHAGFGGSAELASSLLAPPFRASFSGGA